MCDHARLSGAQPGLQGKELRALGSLQFRLESGSCDSLSWID